MNTYGVNALVCELDISQNTAAYHNAKLLLRIYSSIVWNTRATIDELIYAHSETYESGDIAALEYLVSMYEDSNVTQLDNKLRSIAHNKIMIDLVEKNMLHVREYPHYGELYHTILNKNYFAKYPYKESDILEFLNLSRSTYYRRRKDAITTFGISMWGYMLPNLLKRIRIVGET